MDGGDDVEVFDDGGRSYRVWGLHERARSGRAAAGELDAAIQARAAAARTALEHWSGRHAVTFAEEVNRILRQLAGLRDRVARAADVYAAFPDRPGGNWFTAWLRDLFTDDPDEREVPQVAVPPGGGTASAAVADLRAYVAVAQGQDERLAPFARTVDLDGTHAVVSYPRHAEPLGVHDPFLRFRSVEPGHSAHLPGLIDAGEIVTETVPDVRWVVRAPDPTPLVGPLVAGSGELTGFVEAVALAFEQGDQGYLDLLARDTDTAAGVLDVLADGRVDTAEGALAVLQRHWDRFDTGAGIGGVDGIVSYGDLRAIVERWGERGPASPEVGAALFLLHNRRLFGLLETTAQPGHRPDGRLSRRDVDLFVDLSTHLRTLDQDFDRFDGAAAGGRLDGRVSVRDLEVVAGMGGATAAAARWLLDHDAQRERLALYEQQVATGRLPTYRPTEPDIGRRSVVLLAADQQVQATYDPAALHLPAGMLPPPPPPPYIDRGAAGSFGQGSGLSLLEEWRREAKWYGVASGAEVAGDTDAARHLRHYLDGTGDDLVLDVDRILRDDPALHQQVEGTLAAHLDRLATTAPAGRPVAFGTAWAGYTFPDDTEQNWFRAIGSVQYSVTGVATFHPPAAPGGPPTVDVDYEVHLYDRYNWDEGDDPATAATEPVKGTPLPQLGWVPDAEPASLQRAGLAREFDMRGSSSRDRFEGDLAGGALPAPPGGRSGRDDLSRPPD